MGQVCVVCEHHHVCCCFNNDDPPRLVLNRQPWSRDTHQLFPPAFQAAVRTLLLCNTASDDGIRLPAHVLENVVSSAAFPISSWLL